MGLAASAAEHKLAAPSGHSKRPAVRQVSSMAIPVVPSGASPSSTVAVPAGSAAARTLRLWNVEWRFWARAGVLRPFMCSVADGRMAESPCGNP